MEKSLAVMLIRVQKKSYTTGCDPYEGTTAHTAKHTVSGTSNVQRG